MGKGSVSSISFVIHRDASGTIYRRIHAQCVATTVGEIFRYRYRAGFGVGLGDLPCGGALKVLH